MIKKAISYLKNIGKRKDARKLPLDLVYTFANGQKLYTYQQQHYGQISSRYWKAINIQLNYLTMYNLDKNNWINSMDSIQNRCLEIVSGGDSNRIAMEIFSAIDYQKSIPLAKTSVQLKLQEVMFCMFYLLDEEIESGYNEAINEKKMELLNSDSIAKDNFFLHVDEILKNLDISYQIDIPLMMAKLQQLQKLSTQQILTNNG